MEILKQKVKNEYILLFLLFLFVLSFRLYFAFSDDHFNTDNAYFHLRHIQHLVDQKSLLSYDDLSYGGRDVFYPPVFHILMALLSFGSIFMLKLLPEIFISLTIFIVYLIAKEISGNTYASLFSALMASFYPILFTETLNNISIYTLVIPLLLMMFYSLFKLEKKFYLWFFIAASFLLPLIHSSAFIFVCTVLIYFFLLMGGALTPTKLKREAIIFSFLIIVLLQFIIYKKAFLEYGISLLWQNIPSNILGDSFRKLSPVDLLVGLGVLPLILGSFGIYMEMIRNKTRVAYMFAAFAITVLLLLVFRFLTISLGLMFLGIVLCIFSASTVDWTYNYLVKLKFTDAYKMFIAFLLIIFILTSFYPSFVSAKYSNNIANSKVKEIKWIDINTEKDAVILGNVEEGNLISTVGKRKNVLDSSFLLAPDPIQRNKDAEIIYTTSSEAIATSIIKKYNISVIYISDDTRDIYHIDGLKYATGSNCFEEIRGGRYYVFKC